MPFIDNAFQRIWKFVDQFSTDDAVRRSDIDVALDDMAQGMNDQSAYLQGMIGLATGWIDGDAFLADIRGPQGPRGFRGVEGKSAYQTWLDLGNIGSEADFLADIPSAYQVWLSEGNTGTPADFLLSLKGDRGEDFRFISTMVAGAASLGNGQPVTVASGHNGEPETFIVNTSHGGTADGALIVALPLLGANARAVSTRTRLAGLAEALADRRTFTVGTRIQISFGAAIIEAVASGATLTNAGGQGFIIHSGPRFDARTASAAAEIRLYPDGVECRVAGQSYMPDSGTALPDSVFSDLGVANVVPYGEIARASQYGDLAALSISARTAAIGRWSNCGLRHLILDRTVSVNDTLTLDPATKVLEAVDGHYLEQTVANTPLMQGTAAGVESIEVRGLRVDGFGINDTASTANPQLNTATAKAFGVVLDSYHTVTLDGTDARGFKNIGFFTNFCKHVRYRNVRGRGTHQSTGQVLPITGITAASPPVVTSVAHGLTTGSQVMLREIRGPSALNWQFYTITVTGTNTFSLDGQDTSALDAYEGGGEARPGVYDEDIMGGETGQQQFIYYNSSNVGSIANWRSKTADPNAPESDASAAHGGVSFDVDGAEVGDSSIPIYCGPGFKAPSYRNVRQTPGTFISQTLLYTQAGDESTTAEDITAENASISVVKIQWPGQSRRCNAPGIRMRGVRGRTGSFLVAGEGIDKSATLEHPWTLNNGPSRINAIAPVFEDIDGWNGQEQFVSLRNVVDGVIRRVTSSGRAIITRAGIETIYGSVTLDDCPGLSDTDANAVSINIPLGGHARIRNTSISKTNRVAATATVSFASYGGAPALAITDITKTDPVVITSNGHGLQTNEEIWVQGVGGATDVNGAIWRIRRMASDDPLVVIPSDVNNKFVLQDMSGNDVDGSGWGAYTSGGTMHKLATAFPITPTTWWLDGTVAQYGTSLYRCTRTGMTAGTISLAAQAGEQDCGDAAFTYIGDRRTIWADCNYLFYDVQTANFTVGKYLVGGTSGASGLIIAMQDDGATGHLVLHDVIGTFVDNEALTEYGSSGAATANIPDGIVRAHLGEYEFDNVRLSDCGQSTAPLYCNDRRLAVTLNRTITPPNYNNTLKGQLRARLASDIQRNIAPDGVTGDNGMIIRAGVSRGDMGVYSDLTPNAVAAPPALNKRYWHDGSIAQKFDATSGTNVAWVAVTSDTPGSWKTWGTAS